MPVGRSRGRLTRTAPPRPTARADRRTNAGVLERVRQVGANKEGVKGSYSVYRAAEPS